MSYMVQKKYKMIKAGIIGGSGFVGGELIRCLLLHPEVQIDFVYSHSRSGQPVSQTHRDLFYKTELFFTDKFNPEVDVAFLCLGHGNSRRFLTENEFSPDTKIIDMSNDFRLKQHAVFKGKSFVYGLPALNEQLIQNAQFIANPGCFATAIQLALLPLAAQGAIRNDIHIHALTGSTGAGRSMLETTHFSWRSNNISIYKAFRHQHLDEIGESLHSLQEDIDSELCFLPLRGDFTRGIFASLYMETELTEQELLDIYHQYYELDPFTHISSEAIHLKQVVNTNYNLIQVQKIDGKVLITSIIDNLLKGAAGQAIENMNLQFGLARCLGLSFKANYF